MLTYKEVTRFKYENLMYIISYHKMIINDISIIVPSIQVSYKSAKKRNYIKVTHKEDLQYGLTNLKNPLPLVRKIIKIFDPILSKYDCVCFYPYDDTFYIKEKRSVFYLNILKKYNFELYTIYDDIHVLFKKDIKVKRSIVNSILEYIDI